MSSLFQMPDPDDYEAKMQAQSSWVRQHRQARRRSLKLDLSAFFAPEITKEQKAKLRWWKTVGFKGGAMK